MVSENSQILIPKKCKMNDVAICVANTKGTRSKWVKRKGHSGFVASQSALLIIVVTIVAVWRESPYFNLVVN